MRVLVVDDSLFMRSAIVQMLSDQPDIEVVGTASNGREAVELAKTLSPDVITLDIEMPEMDGLTALQIIMRENPTAVLVLSSLTTEGSQAALTALRLGAADVMAKEASQISLRIMNIREDLLRRVRAIAEGARRRGRRLVAPATREGIPRWRPDQFDAVCIGSSTGGPPVLETIVSALPADLSAPVIIAQHMPAMFTQALAQRLGEISPLRVRHVTEPMPMEKGHIYIAEGHKHLYIRKTRLARWELYVSDEPQDAPYRPSVSVLFRSAAEALGARTLAVVLTGIGDDGLEGARLLHAKGAPILAQDHESCVVYGMPKAVTQAGLVTASLTPQELAQSIASLSPSAHQQAQASAA